MMRGHGLGGGQGAIHVGLRTPRAGRSGQVTSGRRSRILKPGWGSGKEEWSFRAGELVRHVCGDALKEPSGFGHVTGCGPGLESKEPEERGTLLRPRWGSPGCPGASRRPMCSLWPQPGGPRSRAAAHRPRRRRSRRPSRLHRPCNSRGHWGSGRCRRCR